MKTSVHQLYSRQQYIDLLTRFKRVSENPSSILGELGTFFPERIVLTLLSTCEPDNDWDEIGLRKLRDNPVIRVSYFYHPKNGKTTDWSTAKTAGYLFDCSKRYSRLTPEDLRKEFLESFKEPIRKYLENKAQIEGKIKDYEDKLSALVS